MLTQPMKAVTTSNANGTLASIERGRLYRRWNCAPHGTTLSSAISMPAITHQNSGLSFFFISGGDLRLVTWCPQEVVDSAMAASFL
jgi:hypothetical protein